MSDKPIQEKITVRQDGTFARLKIEFRNDETPLMFSKSVGRVSLPGTPSVLYANRADRTSMILFGVTTVVLIAITMVLILRPGSKYFPGRSVAMSDILRMPIHSSEEDDEVIASQSLESTMREERAATDPLQYKESGNAPSQQPAVSSTARSAWTEPEKIPGINLPTRIYDNLAQPEIIADSKMDVSNERLARRFR